MFRIHWVPRGTGTVRNTYLKIETRLIDDKFRDYKLKLSGSFRSVSAEIFFFFYKKQDGSTERRCSKLCSMTWRDIRCMLVGIYAFIHVVYYVCGVPNLQR